MNIDDTDQRRFHRLPFKANVTITDSANGRNWQSDLIDISLKGLLIEKPGGASFNFDNPYYVEVRLGDDEFTIAIPDAKVVHITDCHLGISCRLIDIDGISHLKRLMELNLGDPDLIYRELEQLASR